MNATCECALCNNLYVGWKSDNPSQCNVYYGCIAWKFQQPLRLGWRSNPKTVEKCEIFIIQIKSVRIQLFLVTKALKTVREARGLTSGSHHKYLWRCHKLHDDLQNPM